ncbi:MAG: T9SS type A sorting domain-containing protein, partial [Chitinophagaceae bacterium]
TNSDTVAGTFAYGTYSGTFNGTLVTTADAYGTINLNLTGLDMSTPVAVTRLKTVLTASLTYIIPNIGSIVQTTYSYYSPDMPGAPIFRSTTNDITVAVAGIDDENTTYESFLVQLLSSPENNASVIGLVRNPVAHTLEIAGIDAAKNISIADLNGRIVAQASATQTIDVSQLKTGVYIALIDTGTTTVAKKFVKE